MTHKITPRAAKIYKPEILVCPKCNKVMTKENPFTDKSRSRLSQTSELEIINKLNEPTTTFFTGC